jgi:hypothetical protein
MIVGISGSRHDDRPWPPPGVMFEVPDWEGRDLIRGGNAVPANNAARRAYEDLEWGTENPEPAGTQQLPGTPPATTAAPDPAPEPAAPEDSANSHASPAADVPGAGPDQAQEPAPASGPSPAEVPGPSAPKQAWIDYAIAQGAAEGTASAMTKADLMSKYGGRL